MSLANKSTVNRSTWGAELRHNIRIMVVLIVVFVLVVLGYHSWYRKSYEDARKLASDYHLACAFHYLSAMQELRYLQTNLARESNTLNDRDVGSEGKTDLLSSIYIARQQIDAGLELEYRFDDVRFYALVTRLSTQLQNLSVSDSLVQEINTTLNQMVRLHKVIHYDTIMAAETLEERQSVIFGVLLLVLLFAGIVISRREFSAINSIISEQQDTEEKISYQASYDSLTGLPNRFLSLQHLQKMIDEAGRFEKQIAVVFLDLDDFKKINDTLGHDIGDRLLQEAGSRLKASVRRSDIVGRLGGDEFLIILGDLGSDSSASVIVRSLIKQLDAPFVIDNRKMMLTASAGIAIYPRDGASVVDLLRNADSAMYNSKKLGRDTYCYFSAAMNDENRRRLEIEEQMHDAMAQSEFSVLYQPKIALECGKIMGSEALLRWNNEYLGEVSPEEFIPIAEQTGLIDAIGEFVLSEAIAATSRWREEKGVCVNMAVNLSPRQFRNDNLLAFISDTLSVHGLPSRVLELEITEGILLSADSYVDEVLRELNRLGINIAMDDFGTGYSSLSYLRSYPFDVLKIDRSFIGDIETSARSRELIAAAISIAHSLHMKVVAEGVETQEQRDYLRRLRCDYAQGYLFSRPVSDNEFLAMLDGSVAVDTHHPSAASLKAQKSG